MFDASARLSGGLISYYESADLFVEMVERVVIGLYYPTVASQLASFERIARETIPRLRADHPGTVTR